MTQTPYSTAPSTAASQSSQVPSADPFTASTSHATTSPSTASYLRAQVLTATPEQLQLMLYDGAIRFAEQAKLALQEKQFDRSYDRLTRAQRVISELQNGLRKDVAPDLCDKLSALYTFLYMRLVEANIGHDPALVDEALGILRYQRETWAMLMQQTAKQKADAGTRSLPMPSAPAARMERLSVAG